MRARRLLMVLMLCSLGAQASSAPNIEGEGEKLRKSGRYAEAQKLLEPVVARDGRAFAARLQLGLVYRATGQRDLERAIWNRFYDDYEAGAIDKRKARELMYVAIAASNLGGWQDANDTFRDAVNADPNGKDGARANVEWAALFLEKYDAGHAEVSLQEALKILPDDADAHARMAQVKIEQGELAAAEREIAAALKKDPKHSLALDLRAEQLVADERWPEALTAARAALAVNPKDVRARTVVAAVALLRDDKRGFDAERDRVLRTNPRAWEFFHGVAELLVVEHRYIEANTLEEEALKVEPKSYVALAALGSNLLRLGDDAKGLQALQQAWHGDQYNVRTYNLLNLFEDVIPRDYLLLDGKPFRFRVNKQERLVTERVVRPLIEREYKELVARYQFTPEGPLTIELFTNPQHHSVRTFGLPGSEAAGLLGVTFGKVVTAISPRVGRFNWGLTLWHEVAHIFAIQLSRSRVPRWFTEGLSEYETGRADPSWTRRTHAELYRALSDGKLFSVADLNAGFSFGRARDTEHVVIAYHQAAEEIMFLVRRFGFDKVVQALKLFAQGKQTPEVIATVTGLDVPAFDAAFKADLAARLKAYEGTFFVRASDYSDVSALKERVQAHPDDERSKGLLALALIRAKQGESAGELIAAALKKPEAQQPRETVLAGAELALMAKDRVSAKKLLKALINGLHGDGYDARYLLGKIAVEEGDLAEAEKQLALAKKMDPDMADPYLVLGKALLATREADALRELEQAADLEINDPSITKVLVEKYAQRQRWSELIAAARKAQFIDPFDVDVRTQKARALLALGRADEARREIELALSCNPTDEQRAVLKKLH